MATGNNRLSGYGCPACAGKAVTAENNLAVLHPELVKEFSQKNPFTAQEIVSGSHRPVIWQCVKCQYQWRAAVKSRVRLGSGCPACAGKVATVQNNLAVTHPDLAKQYHRDRNILPANQVIAGTHRKLWWACPNCRYEWSARGSSRVRGSGCPACANRVVCPTNNLAYVYPDLAQEFSIRNFPKTAGRVIAGGNGNVWWRCQCGHQWQASIYRRIQGAGCPVCAKKRRVETRRDTLNHFKR